MSKNLFLYSCIFFAVIFCSPNSFASKTISGGKELPLEINLMIESLQTNNPENYAIILPSIMEIDLYARSMTKEDIFLLGKIEIYKTFLKNYGPAIKRPIDGTAIETVRSAIRRSDDRFVKWFLEALLKDVLDLTSNATYKELLLQKNNSIKTDKIEYRKLEKKSELLQFWVSKIPPPNPDVPDTFKNELMPKMLEAIKNIKNSFYLMAHETTIGAIMSPLKNETELKFFSVSDTTPPPKKVATPPQEKSVEEILSPITDTISPQDLPKPTKENWIDDENAPKELQNLPKPNNDADWLQDF